MFRILSQAERFAYRTAHKIAAPIMTVESKARLDICKICEHYNSELIRCNKCKCALSIKTQVSHCPIGKW